MRGSYVDSHGLGICHGYFDQLNEGSSIDVIYMPLKFRFVLYHIHSCVPSRLSWIRMSQYLEASIGLLTLLITSQL